MKAKLDRTLLIVVVAFGLLSGSTIFTNSSIVVSSKNESNINLERSPASINSEPLKEEVSIISIIKLECDAKSLIQNPAPQIRISGYLCEKNLSDKVKIESSRIENGSNEEVATVFPQHQNFTTDIIHLVKGENHLTISHKLSNGQTELRKVTIVH